MMIYVVWFDDGDERFSGFMVCPKKSQAMQYARAQHEDKKVVYLNVNSDEYYFDYDAKTHVVVQQKTSLYHGA